MQDSYVNSKIGLIYGKFFSWNSDLPIFTEFYSETFGFKPSNLRNPYLTGFAWAKTGYRFLQKNGHTLDPLLAMVRIYSNDNEQVAGKKYQELLFGPQYNLFGNNGNLGLTVFAGSLMKSEYLTPTPNSFWGLVALEVKF